MARGLFGKWKSAVYYDYDIPMSKECLFSIIGDLYDEGYTVTTTTYNLGPTNQEVVASLNIGIDSDQLRYFPHPRNSSLRVYIRPDDLQLLKLIRDHFIDSGFIINGALITTKSICLIAKLSDALDLKIDPSLLQKIVTIENTERHKVKWAAKLFSNTVATTIRSLGEKGCLGDDSYWKETADFIKLVNDWFNICIASNKYGPHEKAHAYGINLEYQNEILDRMCTIMRELHVVPKSTNAQQNTKYNQEIIQSSLMPFQHGVILSCLSLKELLIYLKEKYPSIEYILTRRLNREICEQALKGMGRENDSPTALNFQHKIRSFILRKHTAAVLTANALKDTSGLESEDENLMDDYVPTVAELGRYNNPNSSSNLVYIYLFLEENGCSLQIDEFNEDELINMEP